MVVVGICEPSLRPFQIKKAWHCSITLLNDGVQHVRTSDVGVWCACVCGGRIRERLRWGGLTLLAPRRRDVRRKPAEARGRPGYATLAARGGPPVLAVVMAHRTGRWSHEVGEVRSGLRARRALVSAGAPMNDLSESRIVGLALLTGWSARGSGCFALGRWLIRRTGKRGSRASSWIMGLLEDGKRGK